MATFGGHEILAKLGQGGMGAVYKARQPSADRIVALKVMNPGTATEAAYARFEREMKIVGRLRHPNIVRLFTVGKEKNRVFFTMDFVDGKPLSQLIAEAKSDEDRKTLVKHLAAVARAIHYAHTEKVIHRDLKPSNIIVDKQSNPVVTDFGLAKELGAGQTVTITGEAIGTVHYMSPEQAQGEKDIGPATDVYSLGAILYEILTGKPPFEGATPTAVLQKLLQEEPIPPRKLNHSISKDLEAICLKCLAKATKDRYATAEALAQDIERWLIGKTPLAAKRPSLASIVRAHPARGAGLLAASMVLAIAAISGVAAAFRQPAPLPQPVSNEAASAPVPSPEEISPMTTVFPVAAPTVSAAPAASSTSDTVIRHTLEADISSYYCTKSVRCLTVTENKVWWGSGGALVELDLRADKVSVFPLGAEIRRIMLSPSGELRVQAVGTTGFCFKENAWVPLGKDAWMPPVAYDLPPAPAGTRRVAGLDQKGRTWFVGFRNPGMRKAASYDGKALKEYAFDRDMDDPVMTDPSGDVWFGGKGALVRIHDGELRQFTASDGLNCANDDHVWVVGFGPAGRIWIKIASKPHSPSGEDEIVSLEGETFQTHKFAPKSLSPRVEQIMVDHAATVWLRYSDVHDPVSLTSYDGKSWTPHDGTSFGLTDARVLTIATDSADRKLIGTDKGLAVLDGASARAYSTNNGMAGNRVSDIVVGADGRIWCATDGGLCVFDGKTWRSYSRRSNIPSPSITCVAVDRNGRKWFGTSQGLCCFDGKDWITYTDWQHFQGGDSWSDRPRDLVVDGLGRVWVKFGSGPPICFDHGTWTTPGGPWLSRVDRIACDSEGRVWAVCVGVTPLDRFIAYMDGESWHVCASSGVGLKDGKTLKGGMPLPAQLDSGKVSNLNSMSLDVSGQLWLSYRSYRSGTVFGTACFNGTSWRVWEHEGRTPLSEMKETTDEPTILGQAVLVKPDSKGGLWVISGGIGSGFVFHFDGKQWRNFAKEAGYVQFIGMDGGDIVCDRKGRTWFAFVDVLCFDGVQWHKWTTKDYLAGAAQSIAVDLDDSVWVGTTGGVSHIVLKDDKP